MASSAPSSRPEGGAVARGAAMRALGVDLGGTKIEGVVLDEALRPVHRVRVATERERGYDHILDRVAEVVAALRPHAPEARLVGIGTPGSLSARDGTLKNSNTTCLNGRPVHADLERRLGLPVRLENDANCFALAETRDGAALGRALVFGVILGTGVGGGLVIDGRVGAPRDRSRRPGVLLRPAGLCRDLPLGAGAGGGAPRRGRRTGVGGGD